MLQFAAPAVSEHPKDGIFALLHKLLVQNAKTSQSITSFLDVFYYLITGWARPQGKEDLNVIGINAVLDFNFSKGFDGSFVIKSSRNASPYFQGVFLSWSRLFVLKLS